MQHTLLTLLEAQLRLAHPIIPFVTEEIWAAVKGKLGLNGASIATQAFPLAKEYPVDPAASAEISWMKEFLLGVRRIRAEMNLPPGKLLPVLLSGGDALDRQRQSTHAEAINFLGRIESQTWLAETEEAPACASAVLGSLKILIPLAGLIDVDAERQRLDKELIKLAAEIEKCEKKLGNETFVGGAPEAVVQQERQRLSDFSSKRAALQIQRTKLG